MATDVSALARIARLRVRVQHLRQTQDTSYRARPLSLSQRLRPEEIVLEPPHLLRIESAIIDAVAGNGPQRIMVNTPPQHGKSRLISRDTPVWYLERYPARQVILASYQAGYATTYSRLVRDTIIERGPGVLRNVTISPNTRGRAEWFTTDEGGMIAAGRRGSFTGRRGDLVIVDDPISNHAEAASPTEREKVWAWYQSVVETRLHPHSVVIVVMTRWHEDDLCGRILAQDTDDWAVLKFPAIAEANDPLGRAPGEALWEERFPRVYLDGVRRRLAADVWEGMYQQNPTQPEGAFVKREWFAGRRNRYNWEDRFRHTVRRYISIDTAESESITSAWSAATVVEYTSRRTLRVSHTERRRIEPADLEGWVRGLIDRFDHDGLLGGVVIERKSTGVTLYSTLKRVLPERYRRMIFAYNPRSSKDDRLKSAAVWMREDSVELPAANDECRWLHDLEAELFTAPASQYRDQTDALAQIIIYLESYLEQGLAERSRRVGYAEG